METKGTSEENFTPASVECNSRNVTASLVHQIHLPTADFPNEVRMSHTRPLRLSSHASQIYLHLYVIYIISLPECQDVDKVNGSFRFEIRFFMTLFESVPTTGREREEFEKGFYGATDPLAAVPRLFYRLPETLLSIPYPGFQTPGSNFHTWYDPAIYSQKFATWNFLSYSRGPLRTLRVIKPCGRYIKAVAANVHHCGNWKPPALSICHSPGLALAAMLCLHPSLVIVSLKMSEAVWSWLASVMLTGKI